MGFWVGLEEDGGGGGAVGPDWPTGVFLGLAVLLGEGGFEGAREEAGGGGGRAVRRLDGRAVVDGRAVGRVDGGAGFFVRRGAGSVAGGGGGESTPIDSSEADGVGLRRPPALWIAAGESEPEESGQANQMPAPTATTSVNPTRMGPRRS
ncbi:hypothetical protein AB0B89_00575 [Sphaerisporangium sp. NPDC049002]|uniref:hypothetical protein n=1 Tax=unclassified Sphaerisporangium TaxID=2630420 RepID=UPI0033E2C4D4